MRTGWAQAVRAGKSGIRWVIEFTDEEIEVEMTVRSKRVRNG